MGLALMNGMTRRLIVVVGCQRSGTTLTGQILGAHKNAVMIDEADGLYRWFDELAIERENDIDIASAVLRKCKSKYLLPSKRFSGRGRMTKMTEAIDTIVLKAPNLTYSFEKLARLPIDTRIIYPVRDPRAVVASMLGLKNIDFAEKQAKLIRKDPVLSQEFETELSYIENNNMEYFVRAANVWKVKSGLVSRFSERGLSVSQFCYEDLVSHPTIVIERLLEFCELLDCPLPMQHESVYKGTGPGGTNRKRAVDGRSQTAWRSSLDEKSATLVMANAEPLASLLGYHYTSP